MGKYIESNEIKKALDKHNVCGYMEEIPFSEVLKLIKSLPASDVVAVRHGRWIDVVGAGGMLGTFVGWKCTVCGYEITDRYGQYNYCPNCGSRMDLEGDIE